VATLRKARTLRPGDTLGIATPASPIGTDALEAGEALVRALGFEPRRGESVLARTGYLAGHDAQRADELMGFVADPDVHGILCARGGYGSQRILARLDAGAFRKAGKPLIGYSDVTSLLLWQRRAVGLMGVHGPMLESGDTAPSDDHAELARMVTGVGELSRWPGEPLVGGWREGRLVGGSLSLVVASLGTPWEVDTRDAILLLEEVGEAPYRIDRMLSQLHAAGKLEAAAGIGLGCFQGCEPPEAGGPTVDDLIRDIVAPVGIPTLVGLPFGHGAENRPWPHGGRAAIDAERGEIELLEFPVARR
jgi:muramoyltetrapeptide carboxypeptidase